MRKILIVLGLVAVGVTLVAARPTIGSLQGQINQLFALVVGLRSDVDLNTAAIDANTDLLCDLAIDNALVLPAGLDCGVSSCFGQPDGTPCGDFAPGAGVCVSGTCQALPPSRTAAVNVVCSNNVTADTSDLAYELSVTPLGPVLDGVPVDFAVDGVAVFPESFINATLATIPGLTELTLESLNATVAVRSGAVGPDVTLTSEVALPAQVPIPIETDPVLCTAAGLPTPCALQPLALPLAQQIVTLTPTGGPGGQILFGWDESRFPPIPVVLASPGPISTRVVAVVLQVGLECGMGTVDDNGTSLDDTDDFPRPLTDAELISIPIAP
jgi:hypothetical protein